jgi:hypothetical protein
MSANATTAQGKVVAYWIHNFNKNFLFRIEGQPSGLACSSSIRYAVDLATENGRQIAASVMTAKVSSQPIYVAGAGVCTYWGDSEDVAWVMVQ